MSMHQLQVTAPMPGGWRCSCGAAGQGFTAGWRQHWEDERDAALDAVRA